MEAEELEQLVIKEGLIIHDIYEFKMSARAIFSNFGNVPVCLVLFSDYFSFLDKALEPHVPPCDVKY